ncbi:MAG: acetylornithine carbamoyltransferase [Bacteroidia bacterium]|nr:acetylornithine carbamoyltransferase [Bacteroidia bacterium]
MDKFTSLSDVGDPSGLLALAKEAQLNPHGWASLGKGKTLCLLFLNPSLRTRLSTQKAAQLLGMEVMVMNINQDGWKLEFEEGVVMDGDKAEHIKEAAAVIAQYCDLVGIRTFPSFKSREEDYSENLLNAFIEYCGIPVVSLESATRHPLQSLADWLTIETFKKSQRPKVVLSWAPHPRRLPQAVANSFLEWMRVADVNLHIAHPQGFELSDEFTNGIPIHHDQQSAFQGADFVYTKNWSSFHNYGETLYPNKDWEITLEKLGNASFMHCLPVRRNVVVADEVLNSSQSIVIPQAGNRVPAAQAALIQILQNL